MGLGAKLNFAFITVIVVMVLASSGYTLVMDYLTTKSDAQKRLDSANTKLMAEFAKCADMNQSGAEAFSRDPALTGALAAGNREGAAAAVKDFIAKTGFDGFIALVDPRGNLFYSTETPAKSGDMVSTQGGGIDHVIMQHTVWKGASGFSPTGIITVSSMVPVQFGSAVGVLTLNVPLTGEFLTGLLTKFQLEPDHLSGVDMALLSAKENRVVAATPGLVGTDGGYLAKVNQGGLKVVPTNEFDDAGRLWKPFLLEEGKGKLVGEILVTTPMVNVMAKLTTAAGQAAVAGGLGFLLSIMFSVGISSSVSRPLQFLIQRGRDLSGGKATLAPLEGLSGEWLELGELMDTAVNSMRSSVQSLKSQLSKHSSDIDERLRAAESAGGQLDTVNRQLTDKTRQLAEVSKQVNLANQQVGIWQHKLDSVLQISTEGFLMTDQYGNVLSANPVILNWMGVSEGEIAGQHCFDLVKKPGEPKGSGPSQAFSRGGGDPMDLISRFYPEGVIYHRYQEKSVEVLAHLQPLVSEDGNIQGYIMVLRDKSLRSEIAQLRNEIVAMLQDSIRGPLVSVEGSWKGLLRDAGQTMHPSVGQSLAQLHSHYEQLIGLVDSLLMMYGGIIPPPVIPKEQVVITRLVADWLEEVADKARAKQLALDYKTGTGLPPINIDRETVYRSTIQLLEKMLDLTATGGRVRVETLVKGNEMRMGFYSSGPALPAYEIEDMFAGFIQGKHDDESYSSRLSMYLVKNNLERIGGKIWAEAQEGRGTAIFFTLGIN